MTRCSRSEVTMGARRSTPCAAASSSMARMHEVFSPRSPSLRAGERRHGHVVFLVRRRRQRIDARRMRERLVLRGQRRRGHVRDHEARVDAAVPDEERRQARQRGVDEQRDAPLRQRADLGDREREIVGGEGHRLGVEVAAGEHFTGIAETPADCR